MKIFLANLSHLISHDLAADHARVTSDFAVERRVLHARIDALEAKARKLEEDLAKNSATVLKRAKNDLHK